MIKRIITVNAFAPKLSQGRDIFIQYTVKANRTYRNPSSFPEERRKITAVRTMKQNVLKV